jgi:hypothetical protein
MAANKTAEKTRQPTTTEVTAARERTRHPQRGHGSISINNKRKGSSPQKEAADLERLLLSQEARMMSE